MTTDADIGHGTTFKLGDGATPTEAMTLIAEVFSISPPKEARDAIDATHMLSPERTREFIGGLRDPGEMSVEMNLIKASASEKLIRAAMGDKNARGWLITYPNGATDGGKAIVTGYEPGAPMDDKMTATVTLKVSGPIASVDPED